MVSFRGCFTLGGKGSINWVVAVLQTWLVVKKTSWKIWKSMGRIIPYIMENKKCLKPPIRNTQWRSFSQIFTLPAPQPAAKRLCELWIPQRAGANFGGFVLWDPDGSRSNEIRSLPTHLSTLIWLAQRKLGALHPRPVTFARPLIESPKT